MNLFIFIHAEAAYASSLKRARIPLLVDPGYVSEGWLALMTAGDYHYDFVNKPFEMKMEELTVELGRRCFKGPGDSTDGITKQGTVMQQSPVVSSHGQPAYSATPPSTHGQSIYSVPPQKVDLSQNKKKAKRWKVNLK